MSFPLLLSFLLFLSLGSSSLISNAKCPPTNTCGWELMELGIPLQNLKCKCKNDLRQFPGVPISYLGVQYAYQTHNRSLCVPLSEDGIQGAGKEYCTCVFECGNGIWSCNAGVYRFISGCKKYCHGGECDGDGA